MLVMLRRKKQPLIQYDTKYKNPANDKVTFIKKKIKI